MLSPDHHTRRQLVVDHQEALRRLAEQPVRSDDSPRRLTMAVLSGPLTAGPRVLRRRRTATAS